MNEHSTPLDKKICDKIQSGLYEYMMKIFPGVQVLDERKFFEAKGFEADIFTVFNVCKTFGGGSFSCDYKGHTLHVGNGTLIEYGLYNWSAISDMYKEQMQ